MTCMRFTISEENSGWFVGGRDRFGPFFSKQRAVDLAEGMVSALRAIGEDAEMHIAAHPDPHPLASAPNLAERLRSSPPAPRAHMGA